MEKYFASHIYEEDTNGIPMELLVMSPEDKWSDKVRWTTAASVAGAKKNIRAKLRTVLGYDWKQVQAIDMVFGPVKKETFLGLYPQVNPIKQKEQAPAKESAIKEEKKPVKKHDSFITKVWLEYQGRTVAVNRRVAFTVQNNGFIIGGVYKDIQTNAAADDIYDQMAAMQSVRVGTWYWKPDSEYPMPHFKPAEGMDPGTKNCIRYATAIRDGLAARGIRSKTKVDIRYGASFVDSSASVAEYNTTTYTRSVTGTVRSDSAPDLPAESSFFEEAV